MITATIVEREIEFLHKSLPNIRCMAETDALPIRTEIAELAYFMAQRRGFASGDELSDWLAAEREVFQRLTRPTWIAAL